VLFSSITAPKIPPSALKSGESNYVVSGKLWAGYCNLGILIRSLICQKRVYMNFNGFHNAIMFDKKMLKTRCKICVVWQVVCGVVFLQPTNQASWYKRRQNGSFFCLLDKPLSWREQNLGGVINFIVCSKSCLLDWELGRFVHNLYYIIFGWFTKKMICSCIGLI